MGHFYSSTRTKFYNLCYSIFLSSPETQIVRDRLNKYMNSDKIRINDLNYMKDLNKKIEEYHKVILISFKFFDALNKF